MRTQCVRAGFFAIPVLLSGCVSFDLHESMLQPNDSAIQPAENLPRKPEDATAMPGLYACSNAVGDGRVLVNLAQPQESPYVVRYVQSTLDSAQTTQVAIADLQEVAVKPVQQVLTAMPPSLANSAVMMAVAQSTEIALAQPMRYAYRQRHHAELMVVGSQSKQNDDALGSYIDSLQPASISTRNLREFRDELSEQFLRHSNAKTGSGEGTVSTATAAALEKETDASDTAAIAASDAAAGRKSAAVAASATVAALDAAAKANEDAARDNEFWDNLKIYYEAYVKGNFVDHFGNKYDKPTLSTTISDTELAQTVGVLVEFLFDMVAHTPVWQGQDTVTGILTKDQNTVTIPVATDISSWSSGMTITGPNKTDIPDGTTIQKINTDVSPPTLTMSNKAGADSGTSGFPLTISDGKYYPGGTTNKPTVLSALFEKTPATATTSATYAPIQINPISLDPKNVGCGMTMLKMSVTDDVAQAFSSAASNAVGSALGTVGGLGVSLAVFGKISIGDNRAGTAIAQAVAAQLVERTTFEATYPMISDVQFSKPDSPAKPYVPTYVSGINSDALNQAHDKNQFMQLFMTSNPKTPPHAAWSPW
jgi:hypothetical protein